MQILMDKVTKISNTYRIFTEAQIYIAVLLKRFVGGPSHLTLL